MPSPHGEVGNYVMDATNWLLPRATEAVVRTNRTVFQMARNTTNTQMIINEFRFAAAKSIRTSTIILATFNTIAAFATVLGILWDSYSNAKRSRNFSIRRNGLTFIRSPEIYPLVLSVGIVIQGIQFAAAQGQGLEGLFTRGCTLIAQNMLPALFLIPAIQVIFGLETTLRGLRKRPFPPRHPWSVRICWTLVALSYLVGFLVAHIERSPDFCFASLFWFVAHYSLGCFIVLLIASVILTACALTIFFRLSRSICVEPTERVAASRMVYYLALAIISNTLMLPFFFHMAFYDQRDPRFQGLTLSMVASVVAEVSGLMTGGLHLFLRSNTISAIGPKNKIGEYERQKLKHRIRVRGPTDGPDQDNDKDDQGITSPNGLRRIESDASDRSLVMQLKDEEGSLDNRSTKTFVNPLGSNGVYPKRPEPSHVSYGTRTSRRTTKSVYSVFSAFRPSSSKSNRPPTLLPATTYSPFSSTNNNNTTTSKPAGRLDFSSLKPPPSIKNIGKGRHRRDSSMASHITVQLGLRLSNVEDMPAMGVRQSCESSIPVMMDPSAREPPLPQTSKWVPPRPSPLAAAQRASSSASAGGEADADVEDGVLLDDMSPPRRDPVRDAKMKTLPPVPRPIQTTMARMTREWQAESSSGSGTLAGETLSPTVYSPQSQTATAAGASAPSPSKITSPRGVGFTSPVSLRHQGGGAASQRSPPPRKASTSTAAANPPPRSDKGSDWI